MGSWMRCVGSPGARPTPWWHCRTTARVPTSSRQDLDEAVGTGPAIVFVDLQTGSCGAAAFKTCRDQPRRVVVCGVNLPMLLDFVFNRRPSPRRARRPADPQGAGRDPHAVPRRVVALPILLYRIDERLIHGQVVIGWGNQLRPGPLHRGRRRARRQRVGAGSLQARLRGRRGRVRGYGGGARALARVARGSRSLHPTHPEHRHHATPGRRRACWRASPSIWAGVHHGPGREEVLEYVHLNHDEMGDLEAMAEAGVEIVARDLPDAHRVSFGALQKSRWKSPK